MARDDVVKAGAIRHYGVVKLAVTTLSRHSRSWRHNVRELLVSVTRVGRAGQAIHDLSLPGGLIR